MIIKRGTRIKITSEPMHELKGFEGTLIDQEFPILEISSLKQLNPAYATKIKNDYPLYAIFDFPNGLRGKYWVNRESFEVVI